ncbi:DUF2264 domain-containing protein [Myceligenerans pegani]|uniref:DUF2264 domain-containing protein n=1 Tax=Myceligenerans pegani TaxID=2776917 RepID=A0ABR9MYW9_9MICO|nr:DUF2264 domain-containing protein [Myceligenerans sp. TRM 65318]MBE1876574.1 DUF2264 domain-containing protein [Myceligenerans sp. TRM 65318]MBE3018845.1 DUF2264 domain-containing protein [Myceligenerans sp. TRM 65318]
MTESSRPSAETLPTERGIWPRNWGSAPSEDFGTSPLTGFTREHWIAAADGLLRSASRHATESSAGIVLDGRPSWNGAASDALEGFARTFLLLGWRLSGTGVAPPGLLDTYTRGLVAGTDARHPEAWPRISPDCKQALVESASVALALHETRPWIWNRLAPGHRHAVIDWLLGAFTLEVPDNNWHWFRVVVATFVETTGHRLSDDQYDVVAADLARIEGFYVGNGWYRDGAGEGDRFDHYAGWAMHFYPVLWHRMCADLDATSPTSRASAGLRAVHRARLIEFLEDYEHLVGGNGAPLFLGRSLIYRWAAAAAPLVGALDGAPRPAPGVARHLASAMLRYFLQGGAIDADGMPNLGWFGPYLPMVQGYSAPGSPFWLSKAFVCLLIDAGDPFWTATEEPLPAAREGRTSTLPAPGLVVSSTAEDGIVRVANHGTDNHRAGLPDDALYSRFAYSTATAPVLGEMAAVVPDNHVGLVSAGRISRRGRIHRTVIGDDLAGSWHVPTWVDDDVVVDVTGARIETVSILEGPWELRVHRVEDGEGLPVLDSGWAVADDVPPRVEREGRRLRVVGRDGVVSMLVPVRGQPGEPSAEHVAGGNALGPFACVPTVIAPRRAEPSVIAVLVGLSGAAKSLALDRDPHVVAEPVTGSSHLVHVTMPSGARRKLLLGAPPIAPS